MRENLRTRLGPYECNVRDLIRHTRLITGESNGILKYSIILLCKYFCKLLIKKLLDFQHRAKVIDEIGRTTQYKKWENP